MRRVLPAILLTVGLVAPAWADFQAGLDAYRQGDFATTLREWKPLAEAGKARAQFNLGILYAKGQGVPEDPAEALKWYRKAADQGYARAQYVVGSYYERGRGVVPHIGEAYRWYEKAAAQDIRQAKEAVARIERDHPETVRLLKEDERQLAEQDKKIRDAQRKTAAEQESLRRQAAVQEPGKPGEEQLSFPIPAGWKLDAAVALSGADVGDAEGLLKLEQDVKVYIPGEQNSENWSDLISTAQFRRITAMAPYGLYKALIGAIERECHYGRGPEPGSQRKHGNLEVLGFYACAAHKAEKRGGFYMLKIIESPKRFYVVRRVWRGQRYTPEEIPAVVEKFQDWPEWFQDVKAGLPSVISRLERVGGGSGFLVSREGHILTNYHVIKGCREVRLPSSPPVKIIASDTANDLALLRVDKEPSLVAKFRQKGGIRNGEAVVVAGFPLPGLLAPDLSITTGVVSALSGPADDRRFLVMTAPIQPGNSGGPLLDDQGNVVGVVTMTLGLLKGTAAIPQNVNFALHGSVATGFLSRHEVPFQSESAGPKLSPADIGARARVHTVSVECWR
jgi:S1-C subfamily serine protease